MTRFRRLAPLVAALLAALVVVQTTDVVRCADEAAVETAHDACGSGTTTGGEHEDEGGADCLCHLAYVPLAGAPPLGPPAAHALAHGAYRSAVEEGAPRASEHVPLG